RIRGGAGRFGIWGKPLVEITAAVERSAPTSTAGDGARAPDPTWRDLRATKALLDPLESEIRDLRRDVERFTQLESQQEKLLEELERLRAALRPATAPRPDAADPVTARLRASGMDACRIAELMDARGPDDSLEPVLTRALDARLTPPRPADEPTTTLLVGAPGVGKTTTLAKLAARARHQEMPVSLVTTDTYRIGAEEQLRTYASLLQAPFATVANARELEQASRRWARHSILVDTAGRGRADRDAIGELLALREGLGVRGRVQLVLSATTRACDLRADLRRFACLRPDAIIVTKVDESVEPGGLANLVLDPELPPVEWLGTGQRVPEDLELPEPAGLVQRILGEAA
ncbi:MAG: zeta toxin family protein, partial [Proteobacteria bacterium]|nr:zeta toxin family protein [Pseudomonadota bacterium]